jgi:tryptophanyl-tRNA synthetase
LYDTEKEIRKKVMRAVTDSGPTEMNSEKPEAIQNLFMLMKIVSQAEVVAGFDEAYNKCEIRYGDMKKQLAEDIVKFTAPIRERIVTILEDEAYLAKVAQMGAEKARESAAATLNEVKKVVGFRRFY